MQGADHLPDNGRCIGPFGRRGEQHRLPRLAGFLAKTLIPTFRDGFTFDPWRWAFPTFESDDFVVSLCGFGRRFHHVPSAKEALEWLKASECGLSEPERWIGGWRDGHDYVLDISVRVRGRVNAIRFAKRQQQVAIYHPGSDTASSIDPDRIAA